jgi:hypothetical protein
MGSFEPIDLLESYIRSLSSQQKADPECVVFKKPCPPKARTEKSQNKKQ